VLYVHRAERADRLADGLAEVLREPPADPFQVEVIAVPARGVERWLAQRLSKTLGAEAADGVCANVRFPAPAALVEEAVAGASGLDPADDPWQRDRLLWTLLEVIDDCVVEPWCAPLAGHLEERGRRFASAQHLAELFESYGAHRPALLRTWADGADLDGAGTRLGADLAWQPELWRRLRLRIGTPSRAERLPAACAALRASPERVDLPQRLSLFGPTRLTTDQLAVLSALAERRDVHLWLPHPSPVLWQRVAPHAGGETPRRRTDPTADLPRHPLLASLGRDARELQLLLGGCQAKVVDRHHPMLQRPDTLLGGLQTDLREDRTPDGGRLLHSADRSVQVHACHGPARQVEVLREVLLGLLAADPTLEPRDVLVMCPDIETFAPLISAAFGFGDEDGMVSHPGHRLRVRLADRSLRQTNPLLAAVASLLDLADARVTASQVLELAASPPVRRRFGFRDDDLERVGDWVARSGVRWGLDAAHRAPFSLQHVASNTWQAGLDRVLLGAAMSEDDERWLGLALPLDDVDSSDIDLAGRFAELLDRLGTALEALTGERTLADWLAALGDGLDLLTDVPAADAWQLAQARHELAAVAVSAGNRAEELRLTLPDVRALLTGRLQGRPTRANFRTGNLTMCSMVPMRSVPHRVVCLLGLDDGAFPRHPAVDGDDILARDPCVGERDRRSEDRQLLLDAVLAAQEHLVVLYTGADDRTNAHRPPAVPIGELLDVLDLTVRTDDGNPARAQVLVRHPLQPFDPRNFTDGALGAPGPFSFDRPSLEGASVAARPRAAAAPFLPTPFPAVDRAGTELEELIRFLEHPVRGFLRQRLGVSVLGEQDEVADALSAELDPLAKWAVGDRLLAARLAGADPEGCMQAEWRRGALPPGALGSRVLADLMTAVEPLLQATAAVRETPPATVDVDVPLPGGRLSGTVAGVHGTTLLRVVYSKLGPKHRLRAWVQLLALAASRPEEEWWAVTVGRAGRAGAKRATLAAAAATRATGVLTDLVDLYDRGLREPLPLAVATSAAYAADRAAGVPTDAARLSAARAWDGEYGEALDRHHELVWGAAPGIDVLLQAPGTDQSGYDDETTRFGALARRLWTPLLEAETLDSP